MVFSSVALMIAGIGAFLVPIVFPRWAALSPLGPALPWVGLLLAAAGVALLSIELSKRRTTAVFDAELDKMSDEETMRTVKEIEAIKEGNGDTLVGLVEEAPAAETKAELDELVDRYSERLAVSRQTVMTVLKHSRKIRKLKG